MNFLAIHNYVNFSPLFREVLPRTLSDKQKKITAIVFIVLTALTALFLITRCCCFDAKVENDEEKLEDAEKEYRSDPKNIETINHYAYALLKQKSLDQAAEHFEEGLKIGPKNFFTLKGYAETLYKQGRFAEAKPYYEEALKIYKDEERVWWGYANTLNALKLSKEAMDAYLKAMKKGFISHHLIDLYQQGQDQSDLALILANEFLKKPTSRTEDLVKFVEHLRMDGKIDEAQDLTRKILSKNRHPLPSLLCESAEILILSGRWDEAEIQFLTALRSNLPGRYKIYKSYGKMLLNQGRFIEAEEKLARAVNSDDPKCAETLIDLAFVLSEQGKLNEAKDRIVDALRLEPNHLKALESYHVILTKLDRVKEAAVVGAKIRFLRSMHFKSSHSV